MQYRIIDTHCHPQFPHYDSDRDKTITAALREGIGAVCVGTDLEQSRKAIDLAQRYEGLWASVGLHPNDEVGEPYDESAYQALAAHAKVVAIGEIGLDYFRTSNQTHQSFQRDRFIMQLSLARRLGKPVIIHCRDAHRDMLETLREYAHDMAAVIHSFNGTVEQARSYLAGGYYIGLNAIVTFSLSYVDMVKYIPSNRLLLETDAPYLAPAPYRGKRNEPLYIEAVGNRIAEIRSTTLDRLASETTENAHALFGILK